MVGGGGEEKKQSQKRERADHKSENVLSSSQQAFPFMAIVRTCRTGHRLFLSLATPLRIAFD